MSGEFSAVAPPQNFSQSSAFAAALQRAKQIAAKIQPVGTKGPEGSKKRPLEDGSEPDPKKAAAALTDPLLANIRANANANLGFSDGSRSPTGSGRGNDYGEHTAKSIAARDAVKRARELAQAMVKGKEESDGHNPGYVEIMIPGPKVGLIIGKGGETIKSLQEKSGAKMVIIQDGPTQESEKPLRITGEASKVEHAKQMVYELIAEKEMQNYQRGNNNYGGSGGGGGGGYGGNDSVDIVVPAGAVGVVIGKGGEMIKKLQQEHGCKVQFMQNRDGGNGDRTCTISGKQPNVDEAKARIEDLIQSVLSGKRPPPRNNYGNRNEYGGGGGGGGGRGWDNRNDGKIEFSYAVPVNKCGIIIGKGGETIKQINQQTGAHCELDRKNGNENEKYFMIRGSPEQVEHAKRVFAEKLGMGPNMYGQQQMGYNAGGGGWNANQGYQGWPGQGGDMSNAAPQPNVQVNAQTGQPDYSTQWAEYYRSLGMHKEAEMIEQQAKQGQSQPKDQTPQAVAAQPQIQQMQQPQPQQPAQQATTQNGSQSSDYSAQWAEYYRSIGKVKEAEAIEAQMKTKQAAPQANPQAAPSQVQGQAAQTNQYNPQAYGGYQSMNSSSQSGNYYGGGNAPSQQGQGQQNASFPSGGYQNYQYSQNSGDN